MGSFHAVLTRRRSWINPTRRQQRHCFGTPLPFIASIQLELYLLAFDFVPLLIL